MSEVLLEAILRLFAVVATEDKVTQQEKDQVHTFLQDHVSSGKVERFIQYFHRYSESILLDPAFKSNKTTFITELCSSINKDLTFKQKIVIVLDLLGIILSDNDLSPREDQLVRKIASSLNVAEYDLIQRFVKGKKPIELDHPKILIIGKEEGFSSGISPFLPKKHIQGTIALVHIEQGDLYFVKSHDVAGLMLNGIPMKPGRVIPFAVGSCLRWDKDEPVYYGDALKKLKSFGEQEQISFEAKDISYTFKNGKLGLRNVTLAETSGTLVALMGASGAGKSTLLHVLNGTEKPSSGHVLVNGIDIHLTPQKIEGVIGFVPQDDLLIEDLTVYQNLYYAAKLCFNDRNEGDIHVLVNRVLNDLGLMEIKDLKVGSPLQKTISGGQRKRLNIGLELLREPAILFCDEPTSGLSSRDSENIIDLLKELTLKSKLVFAVIHQPSSDIFKMFDKLLILDTGGYQIYYGNPVDAIMYFKKSIQLLDSDEGECQACGNVNPEQIFNIIETKVIDEFGQFTPERKIAPQQWNTIYKQEKPTAGNISPVSSPPHSTLKIPPRFKQALLFTMRDVQAKIHNRQYLIINFLEGPLLAFILAFIVRYHNIDDSSSPVYLFGKNLNVPAYLFMSVIVALFMGLTVSAEEIIRDRKILKREAFLHLSRSSYIFSKISILFTLSAVQMAMFVLVGNSLLEIHGMFFEHWFILFSTACFANILGLNISSSFNSAVTIYILIPLLLIPQLILSGVVVKFDKLNPVIGNTSTVPLVGDLMASRWAFEAGMVTQFKDNHYEKEFYVYDKIMAYADYKKIYYVPELETRLQYCFSNLHATDPQIKQQLAKNLALLQSEIGRELSSFKNKTFPSLEALSPARFDSTIYKKTSVFLEELKKVYIHRYNEADKKKEDKIRSMTETPAKEKAFEKYRESYHNESIAEFVKNMTESHRIIEKDGKLIQKIYPIYKDPDPDHIVDFNAQFFMPAKHFLNKNLDTLYFNMGVIWSMILVLSLTLYFDILRRIIEGVESLSNPIHRK